MQLTIKDLETRKYLYYIAKLYGVSMVDAVRIVVRNALRKIGTDKLNSNVDRNEVPLVIIQDEKLLSDIKKLQKVMKKKKPSEVIKIACINYLSRIL